MAYMTILIGGRFSAVRDFLDHRKRCLNAVQVVVAYAAPFYLLPLVVSGTMVRA